VLFHLYVASVILAFKPQCPRLAMAFIPVINIEKSLVRQRLIYQLSAMLIFDYFFALMSICVVTVPVIIKPANVSHIAVWYFVLCVLFDEWMILDLLLMNKLVKTDYKNTSLLKEDIEAALYKYCGQFEIQEHTNGVLRYSQPSGFFTRWFGKDITILYNDTFLYINIMALGKGNTPSPFHGLSNYLKCKCLAKSLSAPKT
jgi:hypothetical protein